jgi:hypothetical protein
MERRRPRALSGRRRAGVNGPDRRFTLPRAPAGARAFPTRPGSVTSLGMRFAYLLPLLAIAGCVQQKPATPPAPSPAAGASTRTAGRRRPGRGLDRRTRQPGHLALGATGGRVARHLWPGWGRAAAGGALLDRRTAGQPERPWRLRRPAAR